MDGLLTSAVEPRDERGVGHLLWRVCSVFYKRAVRPFMPVRGQVHYAGIPIDHVRRLGDAVVLPRVMNPPPFEDVESYEEALISALRAQVKAGDTVLVVGGGLGVTVAIAAQLAGTTGKVICFEGDASGVERVRRTARANAVSSRVDVRHAIVGQNVGVWGRTFSSEIVMPQALPDCDVLELDCEGAEIQIIRGLRVLPRAILVETHGRLGAPTVQVRTCLEERGYDVLDLGWAEPRLADTCAQRDIRVLVATKP